MSDFVRKTIETIRESPSNFTKRFKKPSATVTQPTVSGKKTRKKKKKKNSSKTNEMTTSQISQGDELRCLLPHFRNTVKGVRLPLPAVKTQ